MCACVCSVAVCMCACIHVWLVTDWDKVLCQTVGAYQPTVHASFRQCAVAGTQWWFQLSDLSLSVTTIR